MSTPLAIPGRPVPVALYAALECKSHAHWSLREMREWLRDEWQIETTTLAVAVALQKCSDVNHAQVTVEHCQNTFTPDLVDLDETQRTLAAHVNGDARLTRSQLLALRERARLIRLKLKLSILLTGRTEATGAKSR